ncbi:MAG: methylated-DNA--[protein]-cysteine S-methyltransferase [candidate division Zixibacteria bacterium]|nr:methylated-DNA--[protein]-cysteine S-methyltransferase [candidate division Zixibacteria bacterium]
MIAGATNKGVVFLEWQDRGGVERILKRVEKRYKRELVVGENRHIDVLEKELSEYFDGKRTVFEVATDVTGTKFEQSIWEQLLDIPLGETRTYGQIAKIVNNPRAHRAIGKACGANYLSIVIPCHRVIEANGNLRGYGGKLWRKKKLLQLEKAID